MKKEELMIGDWVYNTHNSQPKQVYEIGSGLVMLDNNDLYEYDEIEPIPLTSDIVKQNGFVKYAKDTWRFDIDEGIFIQADFTEKETYVYVSNRFYFAFPYCEFVHQLQNAMSLCGIYKEIVVKLEDD